MCSLAITDEVNSLNSGLGNFDKLYMYSTTGTSWTNMAAEPFFSESETKQNDIVDCFV